MNKQDLVEVVAKSTRQPKKAVEKILHALLEEIQEAVKDGDGITLMGFGAFVRGRRKASKGYNPHTGKEIDVPEIYLPKFRPGKAFKERLNKGRAKL